MPNKTIIVLFWILFFGVRPNALAAGELSSAQEALNNGYYELALGLCEKFIADGPGDKQADRAVLIRAKALFFKQEYLKSLKELNKLLRRGRNNGIADEVLYWLAEVYLKVEDYSQAGKYYQRLRNEFRGSPYRRDADYGFAWCLFKQKRFASAQKGFSAYIRNYPHSPLLPTAMLNRAESLYNLGRFEAAVGAYKKTLDILSGIDSPRQARDMAYLGLAWSYIHGGKYASAREALKKASLKRGGPDYADLLFARAKVALGAKDPEQAISLCDDLIKNYSDYDLIPEVYSAKARALCSLLRYQEAIGVYERLLSVIGGKDKEFLVDIRYNLVYAYLKNGDFIPAITQLNEISSDDSLAEDIRYSALAQIADIYRDLGEYRKALQAYKRLPQDNEYARFQAGLCYLKVGEIKKALIGLTDFRKEFPRSELVPEAEYYLCLAYFKMGNFIQCEQRLKRFVRDNNIAQNKDLLPRALYLQAMCLMGSQDYVGASERLERLLADFALDKEMMISCKFQLARCLYNQGKKDVAARRWQDLLSRYPNSAFSGEIIYDLAQYYLSCGNNDLALRYLRRLISDYPDFSRRPEAQFRLAAIIEQKGNLNAAVGAYLGVSKIYPRDDYWLARSYLRLARIFEQKANWNKAKEMYVRISSMDAEEAKFARERLEWIEGRK